MPFHKTPLRALFDLKNNKGGDNFSVNVGRFDYSDPANPFNTRIAATLRMVIDLANFDNSRYALSTRNSGLPFDGATDLNELWARGALHPYRRRRPRRDGPPVGPAPFSLFLRRATTMTSDPQKTPSTSTTPAANGNSPRASNAR